MRPCTHLRRLAVTREACPRILCLSPNSHLMINKAKRQVRNGDGVTERGKLTVERLRYHKEFPWEKLEIQAGHARGESKSGGAEGGRGSGAAARNEPESGAIPCQNEVSM